MEVAHVVPVQRARLEVVASARDEPAEDAAPFVLVARARRLGAAQLGREDAVVLRPAARLCLKEGLALAGRRLGAALALLLLLLLFGSFVLFGYKIGYFGPD